MIARPRRSAREAILDAAASLLAENASVSLSAIAEAAGVGRATLYRYFSTREALIRELALEAIEQTDAAIEPIFAQSSNSETALLAMLEAVVPLGDRYHFLTSERLDDPEVARESARQDRETAEFVEHAKQEGLFAPEVPTAWIVAAFDALVYAAWSTVKDGSVAPRDAARLAFETLTGGLRPPSDQSKSSNS